MSKYILLSFCIFLFSNVIFAQDIDTLFYGNTPLLLENPYGAGFIAGTNGYNDIGKYQRFDFTEEVYLYGTILYFGHMEVVGDPNTLNIVVRLVGSQGEPGQVIFLESITTDQIVTGLDGNYVEFSEPVHIEGGNANGTSAFIGFEWLPTADDNFAVYADEDGEGDGANRAWERFDDGSFNDFMTVLNPTFSWEIDVDLWIAALYSTTPPTDVRDYDRAQYIFDLRQNYPNPFNPTTTIGYSIPTNSFVQLAVFNTLGQKVGMLVNQDMQPGHHEVTFDAADLPSGVYIYRLQAGEFAQSKKNLLVK